MKHVVSTSKCGKRLCFAMILPISAVESFPKCLGEVERGIPNYFSKKIVYSELCHRKDGVDPSACAIQTSVCAQLFSIPVGSCHINPIEKEFNSSRTRILAPSDTE